MLGDGAGSFWLSEDIGDRLAMSASGIGMETGSCEPPV